jgi:hypothetical protein
MAKGLDAVITEGHGRAATRDTTLSRVVLLAVLDLPRNQHD